VGALASTDTSGAPGADPRSGAERVRSVARRYVPVLSWLPAYDRAGLRPDLIGGLVSWAVMVPISIAYAALAGMPPEAGLVTAFAALAAYAVLGTSRDLKVTTSSSVAVMAAAVVAPVVAGRGTEAYVGLMAALALMVGAALLVAGLLRLGFLSQFLAKPVVTGFVVGLAITIVIGQLPKLFGVPGGGDNPFEEIANLVAQLPDANAWTLAVGATALLIMGVLRRVAPRIPGALVVLVLGIVATPLLGLEGHGVSTVGEVPTTVPLPELPSVNVSDLSRIAFGAAGIVFLALAESIGAARSLATRGGYTIDPDQELVALGGSNLAAGLFGGFPVDASLSQSATAHEAGARTQLSSLVTSGLILLTALFLAPLFQNLPDAVLAAIVMTSALSLIDVQELRRYYDWRPRDFFLALTALVGVITTSPLTGIAIAAVLSLLAILYQASRPYLAVLGRLPGEPPAFGDLARHPHAVALPGVLVLRPDVALHFVNASVAKDEVSKAIASADPPPRAVILDLSASTDLDVAATDALVELLTDLRTKGVELRLAHARAGVRDRMRRTGFLAELGEDHVFMSTQQALDAPLPTMGDGHADAVDQAPDARDAGAGSSQAPEGIDAGPDHGANG
jgi:sulfate permease, SulP family